MQLNVSDASSAGLVAYKRMGTYVGKDKTRSVAGDEMNTLKSGLQKSIRFARGNLARVFYQIITVARACTATGHDAQCKMHRTWTKNRLAVVVVEDVGAAAPQALFWVERCCEKLEIDPEDSRALDALDILLNAKKRNRDLSYLRHALFTSSLAASQSPAPSSRKRKQCAETPAQVSAAPALAEFAKALVSANAPDQSGRHESQAQEQAKGVTKPVAIDALALLFGILFEGVTYNTRKAHWSPVHRKMTAAQREALWKTIRAHHASPELVDACRHAHRGLSAGHKDGWLFFAFPCFVRRLPEGVSRRSARAEFDEAYAATPEDLCARLETGEIGDYRVPLEALDCHVGKATAVKHNPLAAGENFNASAFRHNLDVHMACHEQSLLPACYREAYMAMASLAKVPDPVSTGTIGKRKAPETSGVREAASVGQVECDAQNVCGVDVPESASVAAIVAPKRRRLRQMRIHASSAPVLMAHETEAREAVASSATGWSHPILDSWLDEPWVSSEEKAAEFIESLDLPTTVKRTIQATKAGTAVYTFADATSIFVKGPSSKPAYRRRFAAQWLASACKHVVGGGGSPSNGDAGFLPSIATRCIVSQGRYYLLMHDVSRAGAVNVQTWLKQHALRNINEAPLQVKTGLFGALVFRALFKIRDTNFRNIMTNGAQVYSVDEETALDIDGSAPPGSAHEGATPLRLFSKAPVGAAAYQSGVVQALCRRVAGDNEAEQPTQAEEALAALFAKSIELASEGELVRMARLAHIEDDVTVERASQLAQGMHALQRAL